MPGIDHASAILSLALPYAFVAVTPGPNLLMIAHVSLSHSRRHALMAALGVAVGAGMVSALMLSGIGILARETIVQQAIGVGFPLLLIWLGLRALAQRRAAIVQPRPIAPQSIAASLCLGVVTATTNPVTIAFFLGLAASNRCGETPCLPSFAFAVIFCVALAWFGSIALSLSHPLANRLLGSAMPAFKLSLGVILVVYGALQLIAVVEGLHG